MIRLLIAEDNAIFIRGLHWTLDPEEDIEIVGEARTMAEARTQVAALQPDVLLSDVRMPLEMDGIDLARHVRRDHPNIKIILLTSHDDRYIIRTALMLGVDGFLIKTDETDILPKAIRDVHHGHKAYGQEALSMLARMLQQGVKPLDETDMQIIQGLAEYKLVNEIASNVAKSEQTVYRRIDNIRDRLNAANNQHLLRRAKEEGYILRPYPY